MASREPLIGLSYHDDDDSGLFEIGELDVGIYGRIESYIKNFGEDKAREDIFNTILVEMLGRFIRFNGNKKLKKLYKAIIKFVADYLKIEEHERILYEERRYQVCRHLEHILEIIKS